MFTNTMNRILKSTSFRMGVVFVTMMALLYVIVFLTSCTRSSRPLSGEPVFEVRALWVDPPGFKDRETVDALIEKCKRAGINTILPNIMLRGDVWFKSENFIGNVNANDAYDPLAYLIEKAHEVGIKVQPWSCTYYSIPKDPSWVSKPFVDNNYDHVFLSPAHPDVNPYMLSVLEELLKYDIDGIHLDYARYWNAAFDYSDAACQRFEETHGFNPRDFYDHPERIVSPADDPYPVRVLCPNSATSNIPTLGVLERNLNRSGAGYAYVSETSANIDALRAPGLLIVSFYNNATDEMVDAIDRYVQRGGDVMWIAPAATLFDENPRMSILTGIKGAEGLKSERVVLQVVDELFGKSMDALNVRIGGSSLLTDGAKPMVTLDTGEPVVTSYQEKNRGNVVTIGFQLLYSESPDILQFFKESIVRMRNDAGITGPDLMANKHEQWIAWRASHISDLIRGVHEMVKNKDPNLVLTTASGVGPQQYHGIYRDSRDLFAENIVDYIFPMNYSDRIDILREIIDEQVLYTPDGMQEMIYPGLRLYTYNNSVAVPMSADILDQQLEMIQQYGYRGYCLFAYSYFSDEMVDVLNRHSH